MILSRLERELARNRAAVDEFTARAKRVGSSAWAERPTATSWTPAQHVNHVVLAYRMGIHGVRDGIHPRFIGSESDRRLWRLLGLSSIMWAGRLPRGAESPKEIRPPDYSPARTALLDELAGTVAEFERQMRQAAATRGRTKVAHPYFGWVSLRQAVRIAAVHTRHHADALVPAAAGDARR